jgi:hypothetical protein
MEAPENGHIPGSALTKAPGMILRWLENRIRTARRDRDEVMRDATRLLAIFGDEAHDEARRRLLGAMAGDGVWLRERHWSRVRAEIDRRTGYETGVAASARDQDDSAERLAWVADAFPDEVCPARSLSASTRSGRGCGEGLPTGRGLGVEFTNFGEPPVKLRKTK